MKKINVVLLLVILSLSLIASPMALLADEGDQAVATVNGVAISSKDFYATLEAQYGSFALQELIQNEMIRQKADALGVTFDGDDFAEMYQMVIAQLGGVEGLQAFLLQNNVSEDVFIAQLQWNMLLGNLARAEVEVQDGAVEAFFKENSSYYDEPETVEVSHILLDTEEEAQEILALLTDGADLLTLAGERSLDPGTASQGGYLGVVPRGYTVPEFEEKAFSLAVGEYGLAESSFGWHVITVHAKNEGKTAVFAEVAVEVENDYRGSQALDLESYLFKLEQESNIQIQWAPQQ
ncbi:MAG: peptidylprolyl isomerase [Limnochordia bacterium]|nr:peptidylprolyl isomerase [Limnochordia bacterium]